MLAGFIPPSSSKVFRTGRKIGYFFQTFNMRDFC